MRRTRLARFLTAMFGIWFTFTLALPNGMNGMNMSGGSASMNMAMNMPGMDMRGMSNMNMASMDVANVDASHSTTSGQVAQKAQQDLPEQPGAPPECDQHDCCCSAVPPSLLTSEAALTWLPDHIINQDTPQSGDCVVHTDGQHKLPFANGPPKTVSA